VYYEHLSFAVPLPRSSNCLNSETVQTAWEARFNTWEAAISEPPMRTATHGHFSRIMPLQPLYGRALTDKLSLELRKWINAKIDDVSANAYAADFWQYVPR